MKLLLFWRVTHKKLIYYYIQMAEFLTETVEENVREVFIDLEDLPSSLIYKLEEVEFTFTGAKFGFDEWKQIEYYERRMPPGLLDQFPCLIYMLEDYWKEATKMTPLEEIEYRQNLALSKE